MSLMIEQNALSSHLNGLNERQREAVLTPCDRPLQVLAGAGTGKTELISRRFIQLARELRERGVERPADRILVVTFTTDAASAMRARIHQRLLESGEGGLSANAWIGTFHQACMRLLRQHPLEVGLPPRWRVLDSLEQERLFQGTLQQALSGAFCEQRALFRRYGLPEDFPADILSPARLRESGPNDIEKLLTPDSLFGVINRIKTAGLSPADFRETARRQSDELSRCIAGLPLPHIKETRKTDKVENVRLKIAAWRDALQPWAHPDWDPVRDAEEKGVQAGREPGDMTASLYKDELKGLSALYLTPRTFEPLTPDPARATAALAREKTLIDIITAIYALYQDALLAHGACDFDDLINHAAHLLARPHWGEQYRRWFEAIIVDEFQDSNGSQLRLLELLSREGAANLTVVGDEKQSIYGFRFAQPENLDLIFGDGEPNRVSLQTNYRSTVPILAMANQLTERITQRPNSRLHPPESLPENGADSTTPLTEPRRVTALRLDAPPDPEASPDSGRISRHRPVSDQQAREGQFIAVEIARLAEEEDRPFSDIAVLTSSHARAAQIHRLLTDYGIPAVRRKTLGFFKDPAIKNAMAVLRLLHHSSDAAAWTRLLQGKLNLRQVRAVLKWANAALKEERARSLLDACAGLRRETPDALSALSPEVATAVGDLAFRLLNARQARHALSVVETFRNAARPIGLIDPQLPEWRQKEQRIRLRTFEKLLQTLSRPNPTAPAFEDVMETLAHYAANPRLDLPVGEDVADEDAVRIMTTFASKGLEFPVVFVACAEIGRVLRNGGEPPIVFDPQYAGKSGFGLIAGKINGQPNVKREVYRKCWLEPRAQQEARRVFYVALTRARERLYVIRGSQSLPWTDPLEYSERAVRTLSETRDADWLNERYWRIPSENVREAMARLQESRKSRMRGGISGGG